jgi:uncharacterized membrane protein
MLHALLPWILRLHWVAGGLALVVAPLALLVRKGSRWHRRWGWIFIGSMAVVCVSAIMVSLPRRNYVMALVALFSAHLVLAGWRSLYLKRLHKGQRAEWIDWSLHGAAAVFNFSLLLVGLGGMVLRHHHSPMFKVFAVFGFVGSALVFRYAWLFIKRRHERHEWLYGHLTGMIAGYIATVSAFSAVNIAPRLPQSMMVIAWLWPTIVGAPLIWITTRWYRQRYARNRTPHDDYKVKLG